MIKDYKQDKPILPKQDWVGLDKKRSNWWYILPVVFWFLGGVVAGLIIRKSDPKKALICVIVGIVVSGLWIAGGFLATEEEEKDYELSEEEKAELDEARQREALQREERQKERESASLIPNPPPRPPDTIFDPTVIKLIKENIPEMQSLPKEILRQCQNVKSYSDYQTFILAVMVMEEELTETITLINSVLTDLELQGYDKHPEVGQLISETRYLASRTSACLDYLIILYGWGLGEKLMDEPKKIQELRDLLDEGWEMVNSLFEEMNENNITNIKTRVVPKGTLLLYPASCKVIKHKQVLCSPMTM